MDNKWIVIWYDLNEEKFRQIITAPNEEQARKIACESHPERNNLQISIILKEEE